MHTEALLSKRLLRRVCTLGIVLSVAILTSTAAALSHPKVAYTYSLHPLDGGAYLQIITDTPGDLGNADYVCYAGLDGNMFPNSGASNVLVIVDDPLLVTIEFTADAPGGNIINGPVELIDTQFERIPCRRRCCRACGRACGSPSA